MKCLNSNEWNQKLNQLDLSSNQKNYVAFYRHDIESVTTDYFSMQVPIDDHMVHRGDGVFEAFKTVNGKVYLLGAHIERLFLSASAVGIPVPLNSEKLLEKIIELLALVKKLSATNKEQDYILRLFVSRGSGGMSTNPYECKQSGLYILVQKFNPPDEKLKSNGASLGISTLAAKIKPWAQIKSCNYLINVMIKKEAIDSGIDFLIPLNEKGHLTESSTENLAIIDSQFQLVFPPYDSILKGTTLDRLQNLVRENKIPLIKTVVQSPLTAKDIESSQLTFIIGTTWDIVPICVFNQKKITLNRNLFEQINSALSDDQRNGPFLTAF